MRTPLFAATALFLISISPPVTAQVFNVEHDGVIIDRADRYDAYPVHLYIDGTHHIWFCGQSTITGEDMFAIRP